MRSEGVVNQPAAVRVLLVEDDDQVRRLLELALRRHGCEVTAARSGDEGVGRYDRPKAFDVVLLDVQMPGTDGPAAFDALRAVDPAARVVFMTGNPGRHDPAELLARGAVTVLQKPFLDLNALAQVIRRVADGC